MDTDKTGDLDDEPDANAGPEEGPGRGLDARSAPPARRGTPAGGRGNDAATICRNLHGLRMAGWFEHAKALLVGRTAAPDHPRLTQREAVLDALAPLGPPIVFDLEIGHVPPHLPLVNGALAAVTFDGERHEVVQELR